MAFSLAFLPSALADLDDMLMWISDIAGADVAQRYVDRIEARCHDLRDFPARGSPRDALGQGWRSVPFERSATIYYRLVGTTVQIMRVIRAGRDIGRALALQP